MYDIQHSDIDILILLNESWTPPFFLSCHGLCGVISLKKKSILILDSHSPSLGKVFRGMGHGVIFLIFFSSQACISNVQSQVAVKLNVTVNVIL